MYKYQHGGDVYSYKSCQDGRKWKDFSANINPLGIPKGVKQAIQAALEDCVNYPDPLCRELKKETAAFLKLPEDYLFFGNGAADVLFRLTLAVRPRRALLLAPTFADYEKALRLMNCEITYYELPEEQDFRIQEDILEMLQPGLDMVVICNPNNPTGLLCKEELLERVLWRCKRNDTLLLLDECFMDFVPPGDAYSFRTRLQQYKNLVILKAFTKTFAVPGVRLGYCLTADSGLITKLHEVGQDWNVSVLAQAAGRAAVKECEYLSKSFTYVAKQREFLQRELRKIPYIKVYASLANYIFLYVAEPIDLQEELKIRGFLIRSCANYRNLGLGYYRIAVKKQTDNRALIKAIREILQA